jgi:hypothetical protein
MSRDAGVKYRFTRRSPWPSCPRMWFSVSGFGWPVLRSEFGTRIEARRDRKPTVTSHDFRRRDDGMAGPTSELLHILKCSLLQINDCDNQRKKNGSVGTRTAWLILSNYSAEWREEEQKNHSIELLI